MAAGWNKVGEREKTGIAVDLGTFTADRQAADGRRGQENVQMNLPSAFLTRNGLNADIAMSSQCQPSRDSRTRGLDGEDRIPALLIHSPPLR